jgi:hypothetical protein
MLGGGIFEAIRDKSLDASSQELVPHLSSVLDIGFAHDRREVAGDKRLAKATGQSCSPRLSPWRLRLRCSVWRSSSNQDAGRLHLAPPRPTRSTCPKIRSAATTWLIVG